MRGNGYGTCFVLLLIPALMTMLLGRPAAHSIGGNINGGRAYLNYSGDLILGALFPVHRKGLGEERCGRLQMEDGLQPLEAMLYTVQQINNDDSILPGVKLGVLAFDSCDNPSYAMEQALHFVKGFIAHNNAHHQGPHEDPEYKCSDGSTPTFLGGDFERVVAVLGGQSSSVSIQLATLLKLFGIPQISYMSTSPVLSNKERFPYFFRTVPSDVNQAHAMLEILRYFNWTRAGVIYSNTDYGKHGFEMLSNLAPNFSVCLSVESRIERDSNSSADLDAALKTVLGRELRVVVIFAERNSALRLLDAARKHPEARKLVWISSDAWRRWEESGGGHLENAMAVQPLARELNGFDGYYSSLRPSNHNIINPWFNAAWAEAMKCDWQTGGCNDEEGSLTGRNYKQQRYLHFVRDAVYAVAHALHELRIETCGENTTGICEGMQHLNETKFIELLRGVTFNDEGGKKFRFMDGRDGPPRYSILSFTHDPADNTGSAQSWRVVGNFSLDDYGKPQLSLDESSVPFLRTPPTSVCNPVCQGYEIEVKDREDTCCWHCTKCNDYQIQRKSVCEDCQLGFAPSSNRTMCELIPEEVLDPTSAGAIAAMAIAVIGLLAAGGVACVFWRYAETPVIKAAGRELSWLLLLGISASFALTFLVTLARPTDWSCGAFRFLLGFCHALCYAAILAKTSRVARIFGQRACAPHKAKYTSPESQLVLVAIMAGIEAIILGFWLVYSRPQAVHVYPQRSQRLLVCEGLNSHAYLVGLAYPFLLVGLSTVYAIKTRKCPGGFNEARYIAFTNYTAVVLWLAFVPLYVMSSSLDLRALTLAVSLSLSAMVQLGCLFAPKVYTVLWRPQKNTKEGVMAQHRSSSFAPTPSPSATPVVQVLAGSSDAGTGTHNGYARGSLSNPRTSAASQIELRVEEDTMTGCSPRNWRRGGALAGEKRCSKDMSNLAATLAPSSATDYSHDITRHLQHFSNQQLQPEQQVSLSKL